MTRPPPWTMMRATQTAAPWPHDPACLDADPRTFDSALIGDHRRAAEWCTYCPVIDLCDTLAHTIAAEVAVEAASPNGTWGGRLWSRGRLVADPSECGTERGYQRHRHSGKRACDPCRSAHADHERHRVRRAGGAA